MTRTTVSRRRAIGIAALGLPSLFVACTRAVEPQPRPRPDPDVAIRRAVADDVRALLAAYDATLRQHPGAARRLRALRQEHVTHLRALGEPSAPRGSPTATSSGPPAPGSTVTATPVPGAPTAAIAALAAAERAAARRRVSELATASPRLARVIASIGASEAAHAALLTPHVTRGVGR